MEQVKDNIYRIQIPLPFPLRWIYAYAIKGKNGWTIIDTGLHTKDTELIWQEFLQTHQIKWNDIEKIILTHYHPDHYGAAGWLQEKSGAPVYISSIDDHSANLFWFSKGNNMGITMRDFYIHHGMYRELAEKMIEHMYEFISWVSPKPKVTYIEDGSYIQLGDDQYQAILTPGHSDGHICFYQPQKKFLFSGDHILPKITPNVSLWPKGTDRNPLKSFINSLNKINKYDIDIAFPAHKNICTNVQNRIEELLEHHRERLDKVLTWVGTKSTGYEVCKLMFGKDLSVHQLRFAMAETLAHLVYLEGENKLYKVEFENIIYWYPN